MSHQGVIRRIDWTIEPDKIRTIADEAIADARNKFDEIAKTPEGHENLQTLLDFEEISGVIGEIITPFTFMKNVSADVSQRDVCDYVEKQAQKFTNEIVGRKDLYDVLRRLEVITDSFGVEEQALLKRTLDDFVHQGAALNDDERKEFLEVSNNITVLMSDYNRVLNETTTTVQCTREELEGVPPEIYEHLEKEGEFYKLPLDYPVFVPIRNYAKN
jgi:Zn-dependent oligopeptidase